MAEHEITFRQGVNGYSGTVDTQLVQALPTLVSADAATLGVDKKTDVQVLLRFDDLFSGLPPGAQIISATLTLQTTNAGNGASLHRMISPWSGSSTWNSMVNGVQANSVESVATADVVTGATSIGVSQFNVTSSVQSWLAGQVNNGWVFLSQGTNGWEFYSAQGTTPPQLTIRYSVPDGPANAVPVAVTDTISVAEDASVVISVLANDTDADGNTLGVTGAGTPAHGTVVVNQNGTITYTPIANYAGADSFTYTIDDGHGGSAPGTVNLTVIPVNDAPVAVNDTAQVDVNGSVIIAVLGNDTDIESQALGVTGVGTPSHGAVVVNGNGTLTYTPTGGYLGPDSFTYSISDGNGGTAIGTVDVSVNATNAIPVANLDTVVLNEDTSTIVTVLGNDTDADGHALSVAAVGTPLHGAVVINQNGTVTFTPTANYSGTDTFSYTISDGHGGTSSASVNLTINTVNDAPVATVDTGAVETGNSVILNVLANDTDVESNPLTVTGVSTPAHGAVVINQNNTVTYTPVVGYVGPDNFTYTVSDGNGGTNTASVGVTVTAPPPTYVDHSVSFRQGVGGYSGTVDTQVVQGLPTANNATIAVIGVDKGPDTQVLLRFDDIFGNLASQVPASAEIISATLTLQTTNAGNGAALHRMLTAWSDTSTWNSLVNGVQANDVEARTVAELATGATSIGQSQFNVTASVQAWLAGAANLGWVFLSKGTNGWDIYSAQGTTPPQLSIQYRVPTGPVNTVPVANTDSVSVNEDGAIILSVLANDTDADGHTLSVTGVGTAAHGTLFNNGNGTVTYTPFANYSGPDSFTYTIGDGHGGAATGTVNITINAVNDAPVANTDTVSVNEDTGLIVSVLTNDTDVEGQALSISGVGTAAHGTVVNNGNGTVTYTPAANYAGLDSFTYTISDGNGGNATGTVNVTVNPVNDVPVAVIDAATVNQDISVVVGPLANDTDIDGDTLSLTGVGTPAHGAVALNGNGTVTYTPNAGYFGSDTFTYGVSDGNGGTATGTVNVTVNQVVPANVAPIAVTDTVAVNEDTSLVVSVLANDTDANGNTVTVTGAGTPLHGTAMINANETITYTPVANYFGSDTFTYTISDGHGGAATGNVNVTINPVNDNPVAVGDTATTDEDTGLVITVLANDTDLEGDAFTLTGLGSAAHGTVVNNGNGTVTYTPAANYAGSDSFTYTIGDGHGGTATGTVNITINPLNDLPVGVDDTAVVNEDHAVVISVLANDTDVEGDGLSVTGVGTPAHGQAVVNGNGTITYTPSANYNGTDSFTYTISDGHGGTTTASANVTIDPLNDAPLGVNDSASATGGIGVIVSVLNNDVDVDGDALALTGISVGPSHGSVVVNPNNTITYTPIAGYTGADTFIYAIGDTHGGTSFATVSVAVSSDAESASYIATKLTSGAARNLEHGNASKSFFFDGSWWAVLPDGNNWSIHEFSGTTPNPDSMGGWTIASPALFSNANRAELAWDAVHNTLYVVSYATTINDMHLLKMSFNTTTHQWQTETDVQLSGSGGELSGSEWGKNAEISLGLDQFGQPILTSIAASSQGEQGLHVAYATSADLSTWDAMLLDPTTKGLGGSNGNSKADIVHFTQNGVDKVGIFYSRDGSGSSDDWRFAWHDASSDSSDYGSNWSIDLVSDTVNIDNHMSAVSDGEFIYAFIKDDNDAIWMLKGNPGHWDTPYLVVDGNTHNPSRPTVVLDETHDQIYLFYQEDTHSPEGSIYMKIIDIHNPVFDPTSLGVVILENANDSNFIDPQTPSHNVGDDTGGYFMLLAKNSATNEVWYNDIHLGADHFIV